MKSNGKLELGVIAALSQDVDQTLAKAAAMGLTTCQLSCWQPDILSPALARRIKEASSRSGVRVSSFWGGHSGQTVWNFLRGPTTIGLVPAGTRRQRLAELKSGADFAAMIGAPSLTTHVGFIPEDPNQADYADLVDSLRELCRHCEKQGLLFQFETGQETPVTLLRTIEDIGTGNLGINLDPANLILYGKANPVDALDVFGRYVRGIHAKDGLYPTNGRELGREVPLGEGKVDFPRLIGRLKELGYSGAVTIEREISGPEQERDIRRAIQLLSPLL